MVRSEHIAMVLGKCSREHMITYVLYVGVCMLHQRPTHCIVLISCSMTISSSIYHRKVCVTNTSRVEPNGKDRKIGMNLAHMVTVYGKLLPTKAFHLLYIALVFYLQFKLNFSRKKNDQKNGLQCNCILYRTGTIFMGKRKSM